MIHIGLPAPTLMRLRLRAQIMANHVARQAESIQQGVHKTIHNDLAILLHIPRPLTWRPAARAHVTVADSDMLMQRFEEHYQGLVDLLCWSAKDGTHEGRDARYAELREWFMQNYEGIRPGLIAHLLGDPEDLCPMERDACTPRDAFESLFLPSSLEAIINSETVISRIARTRCALDRYREQLDAARQ